MNIIPFRAKRLKDGAVPDWPPVYIKRNTIIVKAKNYITPRAYARTWRLAGIVRRFFILVIIAVLCTMFVPLGDGFVYDLIGRQFFDNAPHVFFQDFENFIPAVILPYVPDKVRATPISEVGEYSLIAFSLWMIWCLRESRTEKLARRYFGKTTTIIFKPNKVKIKNSYQGTLRFMRQPDTLVQAATPNHEKYLEQTTRMAQAAYQQAYWVDVIYCAKTIRIAEIYGALWATNLATVIIMADQLLSQLLDQQRQQAALNSQRHE